MSVIDELESRYDALGAAPGNGTKRPELGTAICGSPHGRWLIFCRAANSVLRIERIMHGARDIDDSDLEPRALDIDQSATATSSLEQLTHMNRSDTLCRASLSPSKG